MEARSLFRGRSGAAPHLAKGASGQGASPVSERYLQQLSTLVTRGAGTGEALAVCAPALGQQIGTVPACTPGDVRLAVERARRRNVPAFCCATTIWC